MFKAARLADGRIVIGKYDEEGTLQFLLRRGHEVQSDGKGHGALLTWKSPDGARMYAQLLNRGSAV